MRLAAAMLHQRPMTSLPCQLTPCMISTSSWVLRLHATDCTTSRIGSSFELSDLRLSALIAHIIIGCQPGHFRRLVIIDDFFRVCITGEYEVMSEILCRAVHVWYLSAVIALTHYLVDLFTLHYGIHDEAMSGFVLTQCFVASLAFHPPDLARTLMPCKLGLGVIHYVY